MRKTTWIIFALALGLTTAQAQKATWKLSRDVRAANNEISFNQGSNGVWYFMETASERHIPSTYSFLPVYVATCTGGVGEIPVIGLGCWRDVSLEPQHVPLVGVNFTNQPLQGGNNVIVPPHAVFMHPAPANLAIVAWKSPVFATVSVTGSFTDIDPACDNGILWFIDRGGQRLASGAVPNGGAQSFNLPSVGVSPGQVLYFLVDANHGDFACDSTMLDLTIVEVI
jgi:hypothetical protein